MAARINPDQLDPRNNLQFYTRSALRNADVWTDKAIRQEYRRLRDIAQKRLARLAKAEPNSQAYKRNVGRFGAARGQRTEQLRQLLPDLAKFIAAKTGTVQGIRQQRARAVETLQRHGYTGITKENLQAFGEFMEQYRAKALDKVLGSPTAVEMFEFTQEHAIPWKRIKARFAGWLAQRDELRDYVQRRHEAGEEVTSDQILKEFNRLEKNRQARERRAAKKQKK